MSEDKANKFDPHAFIRKHDKLEVIKPGTVAWEVVAGLLEKLREQAALSRSQVAEGWISVKDRMPGDGTYLCLGHGSTPFICHMRQGEWWRQSFAKRIVGIAHWMPIAAAPGDAELDADGARSNQCDGCMQGAPLNAMNAHTDASGKPFMMCQKHRYAEKNDE